MSKTYDLGPVIEGYFEYLLKVRKLAHRSVVDTRCTIKQTMLSMNEIRPGKELWELSLDDYLYWIEERRKAGHSVRFIAKSISQLSGLIDYTWRSGKTTRNVLDGFKLKDLGPIVATAPNVLAVEQVTKIIINCPRKNYQQKRSRLMILILYGCGLRTNELCSINIQDINIERQELFIPNAKLSLQRIVPIPDGVWTELLAFIAEQKRQRGSLFKTDIKKKQVRAHDVLQVVHQAASRVDPDLFVTPRTLRHCFATHLMDAGVDLKTISMLMGHKSPSESGVYLHASSGSKFTAVNRLNVQLSTEEEDESI